MTLQDPIGVTERLTLAMNSPRFPAQHRELGRHLLDSLQKPVRVAFIGRPGSGQSNLIGMMLRRDDLPQIGDIARTEFTYGPTPRITLSRSDGTSLRLDGLCAATTEIQDAIRCVVELPEAPLRQQTYVETNLTGTPEQQDRLFRDTIETCQVFVWCSERFDREELALWRRAPDRIKDHSFLVLTKAEHDLEKGGFARRIAELDDIISEEFLGLYPVAALQEITARLSGTASQWEMSGAKELHDGIAAQVELGRMEDLDMAALLIDRYSDPAPQAAAPTDTRAMPKAPAQRPPLRDATETGGGPRPVPARDADLLDQVHARLSRCAESMLNGISDRGAPAPARILGQCSETVTDLSDMLEGSGGGAGRVSEVLQDVRDAEEVLLLLQFENSEDAAEDAVSLMLQLAKGVSERECA